KAGRFAAALSGAHDGAVRTARDKERGVLDAAGRTGEGQHTHLYFGASEPGSGGGELEGVPGRCGVEKRAGEIRGKWKDCGESGFDVYGVDGFFAQGRIGINRGIATEAQRALRAKLPDGASATADCVPTRKS